MILQVLAEKLKQEKRSLGGGRKWRSNFNRLNTQLMELEEDHTALELVFPQVSPHWFPIHLQRDYRTT